MQLASGAARAPKLPNARSMATRQLDGELGPGIVTGAADDDPSGIATYSQAGAQFGYGLLWTMLLTYPLMSAVQLVSAHIGRVTGAGLANNLVSTFPRAVVGAAGRHPARSPTSSTSAPTCRRWPRRPQLVAGGGEHMFVIGFAFLCVAAAAVRPLPPICARS